VLAGRAKASYPTDVVSLFGSVTPVRPRKLLHVIFVVKEVLSETEDGAE